MNAYEKGVKVIFRFACGGFGSIMFQLSTQCDGPRRFLIILLAWVGIAAFAMLWRTDNLDQ